MQVYYKDIESNFCWWKPIIMKIFYNHIKNTDAELGFILKAG